MNPADVLLTRAITDGDMATVRSLVAAGSDVNTTIGGQTPLILAVAFRHIDILKLLLEAGANPQIRDGLGMNAIDWAKRKGFVEGEALLAQNGRRETSTRNRDTIPETGESSEWGPTKARQSSDSDKKVVAHEKSQKWLAGLKKRIEEEQSLEIKETRAPPAPRTQVDNKLISEPWPVAVPDNTPDAPMTLPYSDAIALPSESAPDLGKATEKVQPPPQQATVSTVSEDVVAPPPAPDVVAPPPSAKIELPTSSRWQRCPKCYAIYKSDLLAYCSVDMTPLVDAESPLPSSSEGEGRGALFWALLVVTFLAAWALTSLIITNLREARNTSVQAPAPQAANVEESPSIEGELSGKQLDVPNAEYPETLKGEHVTGKVTVRVTVNKNGKVTQAKVVDGDKRLRRAAIDAARKATFSPEKLTDKTATGTIGYTFK
jgi:TonB family protein